MLGNLINALAIIVGSLAGCFLIRGLPERFENHIKKTLGLVTIYIGIKGALENNNALLLILSMVIGAVIGELINIDKWMNKFGNLAERKLGMSKAQPENSKRSFSKGFVSSSILFCSGSMAIVGSIQSGLQGNHEILFAKSILDGCISLIFAATLGLGVAFSAVPVLLYQGGIVFAAQAIRDYLTPEMVSEMSAVGSLIISGIGFNFLGIKEIKVANLIPAVFIPCLWLVITG